MNRKFMLSHIVLSKSRIGLCINYLENGPHHSVMLHVSGTTSAEKADGRRTSLKLLVWTTYLINGRGELAMGDKVGELTSNAAEELGLREGIAVAQGELMHILVWLVLVYVNPVLWP